MTVRESTSSAGTSEAGGGAPTADPRCPFSDPRASSSDLAEARSHPGLTWSQTLGRHVVSR